MFGSFQADLFGPWGGGGVLSHPSHPPAYAPDLDSGIGNSSCQFVVYFQVLLQFGRYIFIFLLQTRTLVFFFGEMKKKSYLY